MTGLNEEATEEDLQDLFGEYGEVRNMSMALNRRTGYVMVSDEGRRSGGREGCLAQRDATRCPCLVEGRLGAIGACVLYGIVL